MKLEIAHAWDVTPREAIAIQRRLAPRVVEADRIGPVESVGGVDVSYEDGGRTTRAVVAVLGLSDLELRAHAAARRPTTFPYVPGLLAFREIPAVLDALDRLDTPPDVLLCDGQGRAHPRRFGLASHLGVITGLPSLGVARSRLVGEHDPVPDRRGARVPLADGGEVVGAVLRTRPGVKPVYVSAGHRLTLDLAVRLVLECTARYRLPEPTRAAHRLGRGRS